MNAIQRLNHKIERLMQSAIRLAPTREGKQRIESMQVYFEGYAEPGYDGKPVALGNWNTITKWNEQAHKHDTLDSMPERLGEALTKLGVETEWEDEWSSCNDCNKLVRTSPDSYSWTPSYAIVNECELVCLDCLAKDPSNYLETLEGNDTKANTISSIDPGEHGYTLVCDGFQNGFHPGQTDNPKAIAKVLKEKGVSKFLFNIDNKGQFDVTFSVYVHDSEIASDWNETDPTDILCELSCAIKALR